MHGLNRSGRNAPRMRAPVHESAVASLLKLYPRMTSAARKIRVALVCHSSKLLRNGIHEHFTGSAIEEVEAEELGALAQ